MAKLERLQQKRDDLVKRRQELLRQHRIFESQDINKQIEQVDQELKNIRCQHQLSLFECVEKDELLESGLLGWIIQMHLCADLFCDAAWNYRDYLYKNHAITDGTLHKMAEDMAKNAQYMADFACIGDNALSKLIIEDEELLSAISDIIHQYIDSKLIISNNDQ